MCLTHSMYPFRELFFLVAVSYSCLVPVVGLSFLFQGHLGDGSHFTTSATVAEALVNRGHEVTFIISNAYEFRTRSPRWGAQFKYEIFTHYHPPEQALDRMMALINSSIDEGITASSMKHFPGMFAHGAVDCDALVSDTELLNRLQRTKFDALVADNFWPCSVLVGEKLNLTQVILAPSAFSPMIADMYGAPVNLAYSTAFAENVPFHPLTFMERLQNFILYQVGKMTMATIIGNAYQEVMKNRNISPEKSLWQMARQAALVLLNIDFSTEVPVPLTPNIVTVGGLTTRPAKALPLDLEEFVSGSGDEGVVVFSLGSYVNRTNDRIEKIILDGLAGLPSRVVLKTETSERVSIPANVKAMSWLPLNDLLGHEKTKVFVYQGGNNGFYEALYHGVPMVVIPVMADQGIIASRVVHQGIGKKLDLRNMTSEELKDIVLEVLTSERIRKEMGRRHAIFRDKPMQPLEKAVFWIEHVAKFGGKYYRPPSLDIGAFRSSLIDVYSFLTAIFLIAIFLLYKVVSFVCKCVCSTFRGT